MSDGRIRPNAPLSAEKPEEPSMKHKLRAAAGCGAVFAATLAVLYLLLMLAAILPNDALRDHMEQSALSYRDAEPYAFRSGGRLNDVGDNYADAIWLNVSWHMGKGNPALSVLNTRYYDGEAYGENAGLYLSVTQDAPSNTDYTRYWHGSAMFFRFFHLFLDVGGIKCVGFVTFLLLAALTSLLLLRRGHGDLACLLWLSLAAVQFWNVRLSLEYQPAFLLAFALCPLVLHFERRGELPLLLLCTAGGTAIAFFDFLTTETLTLLLPMLLVTAVRAKEGRLGTLREGFGLLGRCGVCWLAAYTGTFAVKWTAVTLLTGENAFRTALEFAAVRTGTAVPATELQPSSVFSAVAANLTALFGGTDRVQPGRAGVGTVLVLLALGSVWYLFRAKNAQKTAVWMLLTLGAVVFLRYLVLNNHSYLHAFFTYRALLVPIFALLAALRLNIALPQRKRRRG